MTTYLNRLAWLAAMLTIVVWVFVPHMAQAVTVVFPAVPAVETLPLPPVAAPDRPDKDG